jgi:hypothetical protein
MRIVLLPADMCSRGSNGPRRVAHAREDGRRARSRRLRREYRHAEGESVDDPLRLFFGLSRIFRKRHPFANDFSAHFVFIHVAGSLTVIAPARAPQRLTYGRDYFAGLPLTQHQQSPANLRVPFARPSVSRPPSSSHNRSRRPRLAASPTVWVASSSTSRHRHRRQRRTALPRRRSGDGQTD